MQTSAVEEVALTQDTNESQPELLAPSSQSETQEQEPTAVVPTEPDIIEGEVIVLDPPEERADHTPPQHKPYWLCIPCTIILCLAFLAVSFLVPFFTPSATITIIPIERTITTTAAIRVQGRQLPPLTLIQSTSVAATGKRHRAAAKAHGTITFYNGSFSSQTIAAGTTLTGKDGVQIITDQAAIIPAGNPPIYGQVTISAHVVSTGPQGNIPAYDIDQACCATSVLAKNTAAFQGGAAARDYSVFTWEDIDNAVSPLQTTLSQSEHAALQVQLHSGEALIAPPCTHTVLSDHKPGDEAKQVRVTVSDTCSSIAYDAHTLHQHATQLLITEVTTRLGANYGFIGDIQITIIHATITHSSQRQAHIVVQVAGTWTYQITPNIRQQLVRLIAGKPQQQALTTLLQSPGIQGAHITVKGGNQTLPEDPRSITMVVVY